ncbi:MAG TPA: hypothetical protein VJP76_00845, partial [Candidatus Tumulicola sp.]|nr:hypothetical protein [Candidatus Tumulicola sp.]
AATPAVPAQVTTYPLGALHGRTSGDLAHAAPRRAWMARVAATTGGLLYAGNLGAGSVEIFHQRGKNQQPIGTITSGLSFPGGMTVDDNGNLYVADERQIAGQWNVPMYAPGSLSPTKVYTTDLSSPTDVAVARDGTIYIANFNELSNGWVSVYPKGNPSKEYRLTDFNGGAPLSVALDKSGDLYVMYDTSDTGGSAVNEYAPHATAGKNLNLPFSWGGGIQVDKTGNILVVQQLDPAEILVFAPGKTKPSQTIQEPNGDQAFSLALTRKNTKLFADDQTANQIDDLAYPSGSYLHAVAGGFSEPTGVAVSPAEFKP